MVEHDGDGVTMEAFRRDGHVCIVVEILVAVFKMIVACWLN